MLFTKKNIFAVSLLFFYLFFTRVYPGRGSGFEAEYPTIDYEDNPYARLAALGYIEWAEVEEMPKSSEGAEVNLTPKSGVYMADIHYSAPYYYIYPSRNSAYLISHNGTILHNWTPRQQRIQFFDVVLGSDGAVYAIGGPIVPPREEAIRGDMPPGRPYEERMSPFGDIELRQSPSKEPIFGGRNTLTKISFNSTVEWVLHGFHHGLALRDDGHLYAIGASISNSTHLNQTSYFIDDYLALISENGSVIRKVYFREFFSEILNPTFTPVNFNLTSDISRVFPQHTRDPFHMNSVEIISEDIPGIAERGDLIVCSRHLNMIAIIDFEGGTLKWHWGWGELQGPHNPTVLDDGNILIFDNGVRRRYSRVIIVDPQTGEIVREYADPENRTSFFSATMGGAQMMDNGNILITYSNRGYAFQVDENDETVWEFYNFAQNNTRRPTMNRMKILSAKELESLIDYLPWLAVSS
jgi:hypothetical protein